MNDSAKDIDALNCKTDAQSFERLFNFLVMRQAYALGMTREQLYQLVSEAELRESVRKAVDKFRPETRSISSYASWWLRQAIRRHANIPERPFTLVQPLPTGGER